MEPLSKGALCFIMSPFVSSPLIRLIMSTLAKFSLELGSSECSKMGGRAKILTSDPIYPTLPIMDYLRNVWMWGKGQ